MKLSRTLKLPRKLKKELKKGFTRNIHPYFPSVSKSPITGSISCSMYQNITYSGSNTKPFFRLCKYARKEQKRKIKNMYESMARDILNENLQNKVFSRDEKLLAMMDLGFYNPNIQLSQPSPSSPK